MASSDVEDREGDAGDAVAPSSCAVRGVEQGGEGQHRGDQQEGAAGHQAVEQHDDQLGAAAAAHREDRAAARIESSSAIAMLRMLTVLGSVVGSEPLAETHTFPLTATTAAAPSSRHGSLAAPEVRRRGGS